MRHKTFTLGILCIIIVTLFVTNTADAQCIHEQELRDLLKDID